MTSESLYGRDEELRKLAAALEEAKAGRGRLVLVAGEPGIGKTRLCDELARIAEESSFEVAWGRCWETDDGAPSYLPWAELLRTLGERREELAPILPEIGGPPQIGEDARARLFAAVSAAIARASEKSPLLLIFDDAHTSDLPSLSILHFVARALRPMRVLLVVTMRDVAALPSEQASALLHKIGREGDRIQLRRLSLFEVERWAMERSRSISAEEIHRVSEGNPLFVAELLRLDEARVPHEIHAALTSHLSMLSHASRSALQIASVFGRTFPAAEVAALSELDADAMDSIVREAVRLGVVVPRGAELAFGHVLLRDELYGSLAPSRRTELHAQIGARFADDPARIASAAFHLVRGAAAGDPAKARAITLSAARRAMAVLAFEDAAATLRRARDELGGTPLERLELGVELARAHMHAGEIDRGRQEAVACADAARALAAKESFAEAALVYGADIAGGRVDPLMVRLLREALALLPEGDSKLRARVLARLASAIIPGDDAAQKEAAALAAEAMAMADRIDDFDTTYTVIQWAVPALGWAMPLRERAPLVTRLLQLSQQAGDAVGELRARQMDLITHVEDGEGERAVQDLCRLVEELGRPYHAWRAPQARGMLAVARGRYAEAETCVREVERLGAAAGIPWVSAMGAVLAMSILDARDDARGFATFARERDEMLRKGPLHQWIFSFLHARAGNVEEARAWLEQAPKNISAIVSLAAPVIEACAVTGDRALGEPIYAVIGSREETNPFVWGPSGNFSLGPIALPLGNLAVSLGRDDEAVAWYERAIARCETAGFPGQHARAERELASVLERRGNRARAASLRASAIARAESIGMTDFVAHMPKIATLTSELTVEREGDVWRVEGAGARVLIKDGKGIRYLERLLHEAGRELHVLDLVGADEDGDGGAVLDDRAKAAYRARLTELREELAEAERFSDPVRATRAREEIDAIAGELARGVGLGGRDRKVASGSERARINVQRRLKDVLDRIEAQAPALGRKLAASIRTGTYCSYVPI